MVRKLLQGNEACVEAALLAGVRFFAGYPITPATEIAEGMAKKMTQLGGVFIQMEDEIASIAACIGASIAGAKAMTASSGPGISLMLENIGFAVMSETPLLIVNVMRGGPSTGLPTYPSQMDVMQARWGSHGDYPIIAYAPSGVRETFDLTIRAINTAELLRNPVFLLSDAIIAHMREAVDLPEISGIEIIDRKRPELVSADFAPFRVGDDMYSIPPMARLGEGFRFHVDSNIHDEYGFPATERHDLANDLIRRLNEKVKVYADQIITVKTEYMEDAEIGVFAYGVTARSASEAVEMARSIGIRAGLFNSLTLWPFPEQHISIWNKQIKAWIAPEMNLGQMSRELKLCVNGQAPVYPIHRVDGLLIEPEQILSGIKELHV